MIDLLDKLNAGERYLTGLKKCLSLEKTLPEIIITACPGVSDEQINDIISSIKSVLADETDIENVNIDNIPSDLLKDFFCEYLSYCTTSIVRAGAYISLRRIIPQNIETRNWYGDIDVERNFTDFATIEDLREMFDLYPEYRIALRKCHDRYSDHLLAIVDSNNIIEYNKIIYDDDFFPIKRILLYINLIHKMIVWFESESQQIEYLSNNWNIENLNTLTQKIWKDVPTFNNFEEVFDSHTKFFLDTCRELHDKGTEEEKQIIEMFAEECGILPLLKEAADTKDLEDDFQLDKIDFSKILPSFHEATDDRVKQLAESFYADGVLIITNVYRHFYKDKHYVSIEKDTKEYDEVRKYANKRILLIIRNFTKWETKEDAVGQLFWKTLFELVETNTTESKNEILENSLLQLSLEKALDEEVTQMRSLFIKTVFLPLALNIDNITAKVITKSIESVTDSVNMTFHFTEENILMVSYHLENSSKNEFQRWAYFDSHDLQKSLFCIIHSIKKIPNKRSYIVLEQIRKNTIKEVLKKEIDDNDDYFEIIDSVDFPELTEFSCPEEFEKCLGYGKALYAKQLEFDGNPEHKDWFCQIPEATYEGETIQLIKKLRKLFEILVERKIISYEDKKITPDRARSEFLYRFSGFNCPIVINAPTIMWAGDITVLGYIIRCLFQRNDDTPPFSTIKPFFKYNSKSPNLASASIKKVVVDDTGIYPPAFKTAYEILSECGFKQIKDFLECVETNAPK